MKSYRGFPLNLLILAALPLAGACHRQPERTAGEHGGDGKTRYTICLLPKKKGLPYFSSCAKGARAAAKELDNIELIYDGPTDGSPEKQAAMIEQWTLKGVDVIAVSPNDPDVVAPAMRKARAKGVHVITWDADGIADAREYFVNQASPEAIGNAMVDTMANDLGGPDTKAEVAILTAYMTAANQNTWIRYMKQRMAEKHPLLDLVAVKPSDEDQKLAFQVTQDLLKAYPRIRGIFGISSVAFPGAAEAVKQAGRSGEVWVTGLATPNSMKAYVKDGTVKSVILWNTEQLGYLTVRVAEALASATFPAEATEFEAGQLGLKPVRGDQILLGDILVFTRENIDRYDF